MMRTVTGKPSVKIVRGRGKEGGGPSNKQPYSHFMGKILALDFNY